MIKTEALRLVVQMYPPASSFIPSFSLKSLRLSQITLLPLSNSVDPRAHGRSSILTYSRVRKVVSHRTFSVGVIGSHN